MSHTGTRRSEGILGLFREAGLILRGLVQQPSTRLGSTAAGILQRASEALQDANLWGKHSAADMVRDAEQSQRLYQALRMGAGRVRMSSQLDAHLAEARVISCTLHLLATGGIVAADVVERVQQFCEKIAATPLSSSEGRVVSPTGPSIRP